MAFAFSSGFLGNFIKADAVLQNSLQNSRVTLTAVDFPIANVFATERNEFPVERRHIAIATRFSTRIAFRMSCVSCFSNA